MGLAPLVVEELFGLVSQVAAQGVAILVVEQFASIVLGVADHVSLMINGRIVSSGAPDEIADQPLGGLPRRLTSPLVVPAAAPFAQQSRTRSKSISNQDLETRLGAIHPIGPTGSRHDGPAGPSGAVQERDRRDGAAGSGHRPRAGAGAPRRPAAGRRAGDHADRLHPGHVHQRQRRRPPAGRRPDHRPHRRGRGHPGSRAVPAVLDGQLPALLAGSPVLRAAGPDRTGSSPPWPRAVPRRRRPPRPPPSRPAPEATAPTPS